MRITVSDFDYWFVLTNLSQAWWDGERERVQLPWLVAGSTGACERFRQVYEQL